MGGHTVQPAVDAELVVQADIAQHPVLSEKAALQFARNAGLPLAHVHHIRFHQFAPGKGQNLLSIRVGDGVPQRAVAQRAVFLDLSVKGKRADPGSGIPHPCADTIAAGGSVLPGFQRQTKLAAAPADGEGHGPAAALVDQRRQLLDAVQGLAVDLGDHVPGFQPCQPRRAESAGQVAGAHHQYTLRLQGHAHGLPARVQAQIVPNLHRDLTQGQKPQQTDGGPGSPSHRPACRRWRKAPARPARPPSAAGEREAPPPFSARKR